MRHVERDLLADQAPQQHGEVGQRLAEVEHLRPQVCLRENASSCRTRLAARLAFCLICMMSWNDGSVGLCALSRKSVAIMMAPSTLLKSCAMPPASWPTVSIFCGWLTWFSSVRCSVVSSA